MKRLQRVPFFKLAGKHPFGQRIVWVSLFTWLISFVWVNSFEFKDLILFDPHMAPTWSHPFGTDALGRDYLVRVVMGAQVSVFIGFVGAFCILMFALIFAIVLAIGLAKSKFKIIAYRFLDIYESLPSFVLVSVFCLIFQNFFSDFSPLYQSICTLIVSISLSHWMKSSRILAERILKISSELYMDGVRALGASPFYILRKHIIPGMTHELFTLFLSLVPIPILYESFMSFVGLGIPAPWTSWGNLIEESWSSLSIFPHLIFFPGFFLFLTLFLLERVMRFKRSI
jgi:oligopeptide transport system permease protein